jgi:hypothetical protein
MIMKAIFTAAIAIVVGLSIAPARAGERLGDGAIGAVVIGAVAAGDTGSTAGRHAAREVNPPDRRLHDNRYEDGPGDGHRNAGR